MVMIMTFSLSNFNKKYSDEKIILIRMYMW